MRLTLIFSWELFFIIVAFACFRSTVDLLKQLKDKFIDAEVALEVLFDEVLFYLTRN